jgi:hypothetical protein
VKTFDSFSVPRTSLRLFLLLLTVAVGSLVVSCERAPDEQVSVGEEDFTEFYTHFLSDADFQLSRITFPLEGLPPGAEEADMHDFRWERADWQIHRPFDPEATGFTTEFIDIGQDVMVERIVHKSGEYGMMRRFARLNQEWYLIYYAGLNSLES